MNSPIKIALISLLINASFAVYYLGFGIRTSSWWLLTLGSYYFILSFVRLMILLLRKQDTTVTTFAGWMLMGLSVPLVGTVLLSIIRDRGTRFHMIVMIAIAAYAFAKIILATINLIKSRHSSSEMLITLRNIAFADAFVSIFALQRSMLVSFEGMTRLEIMIMNAALGAAVCIIVFLLGFHLVKRKKH